MGVSFRNFKLMTAVQKILLAMLSAGLLSLAFLDQNFYILTWMAFVPLLIATRNTSLFSTYLLSLLAGFCSFASATYWIGDFLQISKGQDWQTSFLWASLYWLYCAHFIAVLFVLFQILMRRTSVHEFILFPLLVTLFTSFYPMLFSIYLGESQVHFSWAIQATEYLGVQGLDTIIALANILLYRLVWFLCLQREKLRLQLSWSWGLSLSLIGFWFIVGGMRFHYWEQQVTDWESVKIGIVQPHEIPDLNRLHSMSGYSVAYPPEMDMTERLSRAGADIVVWPEARPKGFWQDQMVEEAYRREVKALDTSLIFQDQQQVRNPLNGKIEQRYNASLMLGNKGEVLGEYQKIKRIPFGEYLPLVSEGSWIHNWLMSFFGRFASELSAGDSFQVFTHDKANIIPLICYETTFPEFVARAVDHAMEDRNSRLGTILVGMSNDGWFGSTHQPYQHVMASVLRSVENRLPLVHAVNNGPSIVVSPSGKILFESAFQQAGGHLVNVPVNASIEGSFYTKYPWLYRYFVISLFCGVVVVALRAQGTSNSKNSG